MNKKDEKIIKDVLEDVELHETSVVGTPAYGRAVVKSFNKQVKEQTGGDIMKDKSSEQDSEAEDTNIEENKKAEETDEKNTDENNAEDEEESESDEKNTDVNIEKVVNERVDKLVKSESFEKMIDERIDKALNKKSMSEDKDKFEEDKKPKSVGELGAKFLRG